MTQSAVLDKPVIDQTGLAGRFDFTLKRTPDEFQFSGLGHQAPVPADNPDVPADLFTAMQQASLHAGSNNWQTGLILPGRHT